MAIQIFVFRMHTYILQHNSADERLCNCMARNSVSLYVCVLEALSSSLIVLFVLFLCLEKMFLYRSKAKIRASL